MSSEGSPQVPRKVPDVLRVFLRTRELSETLEGLVRWRLPQESIERNLADVEQAIRWLIHKDILSEYSGPGSNHIYRFSREGESKAKRLLRDLD